MLKSGSKLNKNLYSYEETFIFGREIGIQAKPNDILCLFGPLGVGKTALVKGIASGFINIDPECVTSPTFSLLNIYEGFGGKNIYHFDLYRLSDPRQFYTSGFEEFLHADGLCCIEWSEKILPIIKHWPAKKIILSSKGEKERYCEIIET